MADETKNEKEEPEAASTSADAGTSAEAEVLENPAGNEPAAETHSAEESVDEAPTAQADAARDASEEPAAETADDPEPAGSADDSGVSSASAEPKRKKKRLPRALRPTRTRKKREPSTSRKPIVRLEKPEHERGRRQERQGTVVSDAMEKTIVVKVEVVKAHPKYKKVVRRSVKFHAHDEQSAAKVGDIVRIVETRPLSKTKRWRLAEVVEAAK